jgi:DNA-binding MarR family transcriptional regulator
MSDRRLKQSHRAAAPAATRGPQALKPTRLDLGVLDGHLGYFIRRLQVWVFQDFIRTLAAIDVGPAQYSVLVVIAANPGASQSQISATLGIERARLVRLLNKLEKRGLVERLDSPSDARTHALRLTRDGGRTLKRARTLAAAHEARLAETLGPERRKVLIDCLRDTSR